MNHFDAACAHVLQRTQDTWAEVSRTITGSAALATTCVCLPQASPGCSAAHTNSTAGLNDKPAVNVVDSIYYSANYFTESAQKVIEEFSAESTEEDDPSRLFLYFPIQNVHSPYQLPPEWETKDFPDFPFSTYAQMLHLLDTSVQNVTETLMSTNLWDNTLMLFSADSACPERGWVAIGE